MNRSGRKLEAVRVRGEGGRKDKLSTSSWGVEKGSPAIFKYPWKRAAQMVAQNSARRGDDLGRSNEGMSGHRHAGRQLLTLRSPVAHPRSPRSPAKAAAESNYEGPRHLFS